MRPHIKKNELGKEKITEEHTIARKQPNQELGRLRRLPSLSEEREGTLRQLQKEEYGGKRHLKSVSSR